MGFPVAVFIAAGQMHRRQAEEDEARRRASRDDIDRRLARLRADPASIEGPSPDVEATLRRLAAHQWDGPASNAERRRRRSERRRMTGLVTTLAILGASGMYAVTQFADAVHTYTVARSQIWR